MVQLLPLTPCVDVYEEHETRFGRGPSGLEGKSCMFGPFGHIQK